VRKPRAKATSGVAFVALASLLWATDSLVRMPSSAVLDPTLIVLIEHALAIALFLPWIMVKRREGLTSLTGTQWAALGFSGVGASAAATVLFTASFRYVNPSVAILLQKLQPVIAVLAARVLLKEDPPRRFYGWAAVAFAAALVLSFPDLQLPSLSGQDVRSRGVLYAFSAAALWALATAAGKLALRGVQPAAATFWRFVFGLVALTAFWAIAPVAPPAGALRELAFPLLYLSLVPGLLAILIYYTGLSRTTASASTFAELLFPLGAVALNAAFLHIPLEPVQLMAGAVLLVAVTGIARQQ
jgi:drug/metabolite transporter, DME family